MAVPVACPGSSRHAAMVLRNGPAANPRAGISRIAQSGQSSWGIARARAIPQLLWPDWAIRLMPARGFAAGPFRSTIAACLLLPGHATGTAITALHGYRSALATGTVLRALADGGHDT